MFVVFCFGLSAVSALVSTTTGQLATRLSEFSHILQWRTNVLSAIRYINLSEGPNKHPKLAKILAANQLTVLQSQTLPVLPD